jgi:hypothetical protein
MWLLEFMNERSRRLSIIDWKMAQGAAMCIALFAAKLFPSILDINWYWLVAAAALLYVKPLYVFYLRRVTPAPANEDMAYGGLPGKRNVPSTRTG